MRTGLLSVASASPAHRLTQAQAKAFARDFFAEYFRSKGRGPEAADRLLRAYDNAGVETRWLGRPIDWYRQRNLLPAKNAAWAEQSRDLARRSGAAAIERAGIAPEQLGAVIFASTTGIATPSLDARLIQDLGMRRDVARVPLWGLGCAGGGAGLARARNLAVALEKPVLLVACEMCSLTFVHGDRRRANVIAVALFGDGAAAAVVAPDRGEGSAAWTPERGPELLADYSHLIDDSEDIMGWDVEDEGLRVRFSPAIPGLVRELGPQLVAEAAATAGLAPEQLRHLVVHPGGAKVLDAYDDALDLEPGRLRHAREVLRDHGNMSSPTVLFVLERFLADTPRSGEAGLLLGLGPGFCAEGVVFRW